MRETAAERSAYRRIPTSPARRTVMSTMPNRVTRRGTTATAMLLMVVTMALAIVSGAGAQTTPAARVTAPVVAANRGPLGNVLVDGRGRTLYLFEKDRGGKSACAGTCASFWPPLLTTGKARAAHGVDAALVGTTRRTDGRLQVTYNGHPLYTFVKDTHRGQTSGENVDAFGAEWYVVSPRGQKVEPHRSTATPGYTR
jgi:predicted lipoprotein with Yx(FWY)xxD motif